MPRHAGCVCARVTRQAQQRANPKTHRFQLFQALREHDDCRDGGHKHHGRSEGGELACRVVVCHCARQIRRPAMHGKIQCHRQQGVSCAGPRHALATQPVQFEGHPGGHGSCARTHDTQQAHDETHAQGAMHTRSCTRGLARARACVCVCERERGKKHMCDYSDVDRTEFGLVAFKHGAHGPERAGRRRRGLFPRLARAALDLVLSGEHFVVRLVPVSLLPFACHARACFFFLLCLARAFLAGGFLPAFGDGVLPRGLLRAVFAFALLRCGVPLFALALFALARLSTRGARGGGGGDRLPGQRPMHPKRTTDQWRQHGGLVACLAGSTTAHIGEVCARGGCARWLRAVAARGGCAPRLVRTACRPRGPPGFRGAEACPLPHFVPPRTQAVAEGAGWGGGRRVVWRARREANPRSNKGPGPPERSPVLCLFCGPSKPPVPCGTCPRAPRAPRHCRWDLPSLCCLFCRHPPGSRSAQPAPKNP